jgi:hypothetical protein
MKRREYFVSFLQQSSRGSMQLLTGQIPQLAFSYNKSTWLANQKNEYFSSIGGLSPLDEFYHLVGENSNHQKHGWYLLNLFFNQIRNFIA